MATKAEGSPDEIERLKARVAELEASLKRERRRKEASAGSTGDSMRDSMNRVTDEYARLFRGLTTAYLEGLGVAAEAAGAFFKGVQESNPARESSGEPVATVMDQARSMGTGCTSAFTDAVNKAVEIPKRSVDKFYEAYSESETA